MQTQITTHARLSPLPPSPQPPLITHGPCLPTYPTIITTSTLLHHRHKHVSHGMVQTSRPYVTCTCDYQEDKPPNGLGDKLGLYYYNYITTTITTTTVYFCMYTTVHSKRAVWTTDKKKNRAAGSKRPSRVDLGVRKPRRGGKGLEGGASPPLAATSSEHLHRTVLLQRGSNM